MTRTMLRPLTTNPDANDPEPLGLVVVRTVAAKTAMVAIEVALPTALAVALWGWPGLAVGVIPIAMTRIRKKIARSVRNHGVVPRLSRVLELEEDEQSCS